MENQNKIELIKQYEKLMEETIITPSDDYNAKMQPIRNLINKILPKSLFRFRTFNEFSIDSFWKDSIRYSQPDSFNDPHDCLIYIDKELIIEKIRTDLLPQNLEIIFKKWHNWEQQPDDFFLPYKKESPEIQKIAKELSNNKIDFYKELETNPDKYHFAEEQIIKILEKVEKTMYDHFRTHHKIACFSEDIYSTLMWAHYANYHKGFALEYDTEKMQSMCFKCEKYSNCNDFTIINLYPIIYRNKRYDATALSEFFIINQFLIKLGLPINYNMPDQLAYTKTYLYKGKNWEYENEWRSILVCNNLQKKEIFVKPKAVYLGENISHEHQSIIVNCAKIHDIEIYKMKIDIYSEEFKLTYEKF